MVDVEARNAVVAMVQHLLSAFKLPARSRRPLDPPGVAPDTPLVLGEFRTVIVSLGRRLWDLVICPTSVSLVQHEGLRNVDAMVTQGIHRQDPASALPAVLAAQASKVDIWGLKGGYKQQLQFSYRVIARRLR